MKNKLIILSILAFITIAEGSCFTENTTIETTEIGDQVIDILGCSLIGLNSNWEDIITIFISGVIFIMLFSSIILMILLARYYGGKS